MPRICSRLQRFDGGRDGDPAIAPQDQEDLSDRHFPKMLAGLIPQSKLKIYPNAAHGFLFQHAAEFAADGNTLKEAPEAL